MQQLREAIGGTRDQRDPARLQTTATGMAARTVLPAKRGPVSTHTSRREMVAVAAVRVL